MSRSPQPSPTIKTPDGARLARDTAKLFKRKPDSEWRDHIEAVAKSGAAS